MCLSVSREGNKDNRVLEIRPWFRSCDHLQIVNDENNREYNDSDKYFFLLITCNFRTLIVGELNE